MSGKENGHESDSLGNAETPNSKKSTPEFPIETQRHSGAHLMAYALHKLFPGTLFGVGPDIRDGWYYDVKLPSEQQITADQFKAIEKEMFNLKRLKIPFERTEVPIDEAIDLMEKLHQPYKVELLKDLKTKGTTAVKDTGDANAVDTSAGGVVTSVTLYKLGDFVDLCRGPHVSHTGQVAEFELNKVSGAYWRGDSAKDALIRIYALSYATKEQIHVRKQQIENAKRRDHRVLGEKHRLFFIEPELIGPGLVMWEPKGMVIVNELMHLAKKMENRYGYQEVSTPELAYKDLFEKSGHIAHYRDDMFPPMSLKGEKEVFLKPMSCPFHHTIYSANGTPSYQTLPKRLKEWGKVHRYEASGVLSGLNRVRGITQDDSHIYAREDQVIDELIDVIRLSEEYYKLFGFNNYRIDFALPDFVKKAGKYIDDPEAWEKSITLMRTAIEKAGVRYKDAIGEAAFYGPKFDFVIEDEVTGKEFTISTVQLDFGATTKFDLKYLGSDGNRHPVFVIHRAPLGSLERITATLIKHYEARFPAWLAPEQVRILTISGMSPEAVAYAEKTKKWLDSQVIDNGSRCLRTSIDASNATINKKIRTGQLEQVPYMVIIGENEVATHTLSIRFRSGSQVNGVDPEKFLERVRYEAEEYVDLGEDVSMEQTPRREKTSFKQFQA
jgi:threonyl-tRNA synthetase